MFQTIFISSCIIIGIMYSDSHEHALRVYARFHALTCTHTHVIMCVYYCVLYCATCTACHVLVTGCAKRRACHYSITAAVRSCECMPSSARVSVCPQVHMWVYALKCTCECMPSSAHVSVCSHVHMWVYALIHIWVCSSCVYVALYMSVNMSTSDNHVIIG